MVPMTYTIRVRDDQLSFVSRKLHLLQIIKQGQFGVLFNNNFAN